MYDKDGKLVVSGDCLAHLIRRVSSASPRLIVSVKLAESAEEVATGGRVSDDQAALGRGDGATAPGATKRDTERRGDITLAKEAATGASVENSLECTSL